MVALVVVVVVVVVVVIVVVVPPGLFKKGGCEAPILNEPLRIYMFKTGGCRPFKQ